jgi:hypothetical protein
VNFAEQRFHDAERLLDEALATFRASASSHGIVIRDWSARSYHYKNEFLIWDVQFVRDAVQDGETQRTSLRLSFREPAAPADIDEVEISLRYEEFRQGQASFINQESEWRASIEALRGVGMTEILRDGFQRAAERAA